MPFGINFARQPRWNKVTVTGHASNGAVKPALHMIPQATDPTGGIKGSETFSSTANGHKQHDGTVWRALADRIVVPVDLAAASVDQWAFVADRPYKALGFREAHSVVGGAAAAVRPRKVTDTSAPGAAASGTVVELTSANIDLTATINTVVTPTLVTAGGANLLATGDKIGLDFSGTLTGLVGKLFIYLEQV